MDKIDKIKKSIREIKKNDEPGCIILNPRVYDELKRHTVIHNNITKMFEIPIIVENITEECLILSKFTLNRLRELYEIN